MPDFLRPLEGAPCSALPEAKANVVDHVLRSEVGVVRQNGGRIVGFLGGFAAFWSTSQTVTALFLPVSDAMPATLQATQKEARQQGKLPVIYKCPARGGTLMRYGRDAPNGTMHALIHYVLQAAQAQAVTKLSLAAVPPRRAPANPVLRHLHGQVLQQAGHAGLSQFKSCFAPDWTPRYAASRHPVALALGLADIAREVHGAETERGHGREAWPNMPWQTVPSGDQTSALPRTVGNGARG